MRFVLGTRTTYDEDTIVSWITEGDPSSESVMGSTGLFQSPAPVATAENPTAVPSESAVGNRSGQDSPASVEHRVRLVSIDQEGAHFEFPSAALVDEELRNSFPRKCVGCGARHGLTVHLVFWPDRMRSQDAVHWREYQNTGIGDYEQYAHLEAATWLQRLPGARHSPPPFDQAFPFLVCRHCQAAREIEGRCPGKGFSEVCRLLIRSLATAVDFYRHNGGRHTTEYQRLIEERDIRHDRRNELTPEVRHRLSHWFTALPGEEFVRYFPDAEFSPAETGTAGAVLTVRRLVFKKYAAYRDYPLNRHCRMEMKTGGSRTTVQVFEEAHRPAVFILSDAHASQLVLALRSLNCRWNIVRESP